MKGCAFSLFLSVLWLAAIAGAISWGLQQAYALAPGDTILPSLVGGFAGWIAGNLLWSSVKTWRERATLVKGLAGEAPVDGRQAVLVGQIEPVGAPLITPFTGTECVAYTFEISRMSNAFRRPTKVVHFDGIALTPSVIVTRAGAFRLLAVPDLDCEEAIVSSEAGIGHATDFVARTTFEAPPPPFTRPSLERQWSDDDGAYLRQTRRVTDDVNLADCILAQRQIPRGARVCVFGQYSESRRAIVANPNDWSKTTRVMTGDAEAIVRRLRSRAIGRLIGGLVALALAAAAVMALMPQSS